MTAVVVASSARSDDAKAFVFYLAVWVVFCVLGMIWERKVK